jgi:3-(3-hydroxy-phenyl)propionate hydroxylase
VTGFVHPRFARAPRAGCDGERVPVAIVGAGPVGLALAIDLAQRDVPVVVLDDDDTVSAGSRAICWSKRTLEIFDRLGVGEPIVARGVRWNTGRVFFGEREVFAFDLAPEAGHRRPAFVNLQQYHVEALLVERARSLPACRLRFGHRVTGVEVRDAGVRVRVDTGDGGYAFDAGWLVACDGARSGVRHALGLAAKGQVFNDRFLIADVRMRSAFPAERWFWFDPPFHRRQSALLHRQADDVWRLDFQLGADADADAERAPERVAARVRAMLGADIDFTLEWASVYTFQCRRMERFRHGAVLFAGDAAHVVSPFGARGANSGVQDADNLGWKLAAVLSGEAPDALIDSYDAERGAAADDNIRHSTRSTDFITPKSAASRRYRDAVLDLARDHPFARQWVNSGRLSSPAVHDDSPLNTPDAAGAFGEAAHGARPGAVAPDAPLDGGGAPWLIDRLGGRFALVAYGADGEVARTALADCAIVEVAAAATGARAGDRDGHVARRYDMRPGTCYLVRPDQHICARWRALDAAAVRAAVERARGRG